MNERLLSLLPQRIGGQIALLVLIAIVVIQTIVTTAFFLERREGGPGGRHAPQNHLAATVRLLDAAPDNAAREGILAAAARAFPDMVIHPAAGAAPAGGDRPPADSDFIRDIRSVGVTVTEEPDAESDKMVLRIRLRDGTDLIALSPPPLPPLINSFTFGLLFFAVSAGLLAVWAARGLTAPLTALAQAAADFDIAGDAPPLRERGPEEVRTVARAFNAMHRRIRRLVEDRTRMLAAVGHDLRTPTTRLRLRAEFIEDDHLRAQTLSDLDQMARMIDSAVSMLRDGAAAEPMTRIDLAAALQTICDQHADTGDAVAYDGPDHLSVTARPEEINRAVTNLVQNAVTYGGGAVVRLAAEDAGIVIDVMDEGPGIPGDSKTAMLAPFVRGDAARTMTAASGFGLGLSIAQAIVEAHGGTLSLLDRQPKGLTARIALPAA